MHLLKWITLITMACAVCLADTAIVTFTHLPYDSSGFPGWSIANVDGIDAQLLMCDDHYHNTNMPSPSYVYDYSVLWNDLSHINTLEFGSTPAYVSQDVDHNPSQDYQAAAYLLWEYSLVGYNSASPTPGPTAAQNQAAADYNTAIWNLFDAAGVAMTATQASYQAAAIAFVTSASGADLAFLNALYKQVVVYTPGAAASGNAFTSAGQQEFLQLVPEPATVWFLLGGVGLGVVARRRARTSG